ncbi:hypothetical protein WR25_02542 isoform B [Diploscapter pachys]|nr:hypothetical protein WR25_02542 isoform B [Diploscapter pachys]
MIFYFDYRKDSTSESSGECIDWRSLRRLKVQNKWGVLRHPYILNYINERLIDCAIFYTMHIIAFFLFLLLLSWHIFSRTIFKDWLVTIFVAVFSIFMLTKGSVKARISRSVSFWFVVAYVFNLLTYAATLAYVWLPTIFSFDDYHQQVKNIVLWFLPIIAIISAWMNFLYILRKSPYGIYIFMMVRILRSFGHIATIWIPTLIAFSFAFHLIMRDSGIEPWIKVDNDPNSTFVEKLFVILQAVTKTSTMMIGEVDANDILGTKQWIPSILVLAFEIITVILLMNLMVSLAVGDVSDLRNSAQDKLLRIKVNYIIEALQLSENIDISLCRLHEKQTNNILVVDSTGHYYTTHGTLPDFSATASRPKSPYADILDEYSNRSYQLTFVDPGMRVRVAPLIGRNRGVLFKNISARLIETAESGIAELTGPNTSQAPYEEPSYCLQFKQWIIGFDMKAFLDL